MARRALPVLLAALLTACAGAAGFREVPSVGQVVILVWACIFAAALQMITSSTLGSKKGWTPAISKVAYATLTGGAAARLSA
jgi:hypothetical protein